MTSLRVVLDTNIVVSAALKPDSLQRTVLLLAFSRPARLYVSRQILDEYSGVLARPELRIARGARLQLLQHIRSHARVVEPIRTIRITPDPDDNIFIECADKARADYLVSGNLRHFPAYWKCTKIINARDFLTILAPHLLS